jgi:hypothetical protein
MRSSRIPLTLTLAEHSHSPSTGQEVGKEAKVGMADPQNLAFNRIVGAQIDIDN